jgi:hypothetical protein
MIVKIRLATETTVIKSHTMAVARLAPVTASVILTVGLCREVGGWL